jgi:K(+)-stimulated pyrophosphate-energized sodium pump
VTDNAQSVYELSLIETVPNVEQEIQRDFGFRPSFEKGEGLPGRERRRRQHLQGDRQAGADRYGRGRRDDHDLLDHHDADERPHDRHGQALDHARALSARPPGRGGAVVYWFTGGATQAVATGAYRAVEFIKKNIKLEGVVKASVEDSKKVVEICTKYAQRGMFNLFLAIFFSTLAFACMEPFLFIGYLISIALFGLYQAIFMANAGGAWDNAKKIVEVELKAKGTPLTMRASWATPSAIPSRTRRRWRSTRSSSSRRSSACLPSSSRSRWTPA